MPPRARGRPRKSAPPSPVRESSLESIHEAAEPTIDQPPPAAAEFVLPASADEPQVETFQLPAHTETEPELPPPPPEPPVFANMNPFAAAPSGPSPMDISPEIAARRRDTLAKIRRYKSQFLALQNYPVDENASLDRLEETLQSFRSAVGNKTSLAVFKSTYVTAIRGLEKAAKAVGGRCEGSADILARSEQVECLLKVVLAEYGVGERVSPLGQICFVSLATLLSVHALNSRAEALRNLTARQADATLRQDFADL